MKIVMLLQKSVSTKCVVVPDPSGPWSITNTAMKLFFCSRLTAQCAIFTNKKSGSIRNYDKAICNRVVILFNKEKIFFF